jgi:hypothetical protein
VLLDLRRVGRVDRGAGPMLDGLAASLAATGGQLVLAGRAETLARLSSAGLSAAGAILRFPDIDAALEWAEDRLLGLPERGADLVPAIGLADHDLVQGLDPAAIERLRGFLDCRRWRAGEMVVRRGDPTDELFLLTSGEATASVDLAGGGRRRLSTIGAGSVLGELAFLGGDRRTADVVADAPLEAFVLTRDAFDELGREDAALKAAVLENLLRMVVRVARRMTDEVAALAG